VELLAALDKRLGVESSAAPEATFAAPATAATTAAVGATAAAPAAEAAPLKAETTALTPPGAALEAVATSAATTVASTVKELNGEGGDGGDGGDSKDGGGDGDEAAAKAALLQDAVMFEKLKAAAEKMGDSIARSPASSPVKPPCGCRELEGTDGSTEEPEGGVDGVCNGAVPSGSLPREVSSPASEAAVLTTPPKAPVDAPQTHPRDLSLPKVLQIVAGGGVPPGVVAVPAGRTSADLPSAAGGGSPGKPWESGGAGTDKGQRREGARASHIK